MVQHNINEWSYTLDASKLVGDQIEVKFLIKNNDNNENIVWEYSDNRTLTLPTMEEGDVVVYELAEAAFPLPAVRVAGTLVPLFSLRSQTSFGIGDFGDLKKMIDWVSMTHQRAFSKFFLSTIQLSTTHLDLTPILYSCISIFALHPQYC